MSRERKYAISIDHKDIIFDLFVTLKEYKEREEKRNGSKNAEEGREIAILSSICNICRKTIEGKDAELCFSYDEKHEIVKNLRMILNDEDGLFFMQHPEFDRVEYEKLLEDIG